VGKEVDVLKRIWRDVLYKPILDDFFANAQSIGAFLTPDAAMVALKEDLTALVSETRSESAKASTVRPRQQPRMDLFAGLRDAHHYAVELFYKNVLSAKGRATHSGRRSYYLAQLTRGGPQL